MIELYLDCEFNGNKGAFISMALYRLNRESFYEVNHDWEYWITKDKDQGGINPWVKNNVIPMLLKPAISFMEIQAKLVTYLQELKTDKIIVYADWPEDFKHFLDYLFTINPNTQIPSKLISKLTMELITTPDTHKSKYPHNALADAEALYLNHREMLK